MPKQILQRIYNLLLPYQRRERVDIQPALLILSSACGKPFGKAEAAQGKPSRSAVSPPRVYVQNF